MPDPLAGLPPRCLRTPEAARFLGLSGRTLEKHRTYGTGPRYSKLGGRVVYRLDDLQAWLNRGAKDLHRRTRLGQTPFSPAKPHSAIRSPAMRAKPRR